MERLEQHAQTPLPLPRRSLDASNRGNPSQPCIAENSRVLMNRNALLAPAIKDERFRSTRSAPRL